MTVQDDAAAIGGELAGLRRQIHQDPEIGLDLPNVGSDDHGLGAEI